MKNVDDILRECKDLPPEEGTVFKFEKPGDAIVARFSGRRRNVSTKKSATPATCLDCEILSAVNSNARGPATIFESGHITQLMDRVGLMPGQGFYLRLHEVDGKTRFKKFSYKRLIENDLGNDYKDDPGEPPAYFEEARK